MSKKKLKVGVVGVGALGRHHTRLYAKNEKAKLVGIYDADPKAAKKISKEFKVKIFPSVESLVEACDALSIAVPATKHHSLAKPLLEKNKHLLMEKPLAATVEEAGELVALAESRNLVLEVGHTERYNPIMGFIDDKIDEVHYIEARRLAPYPPPRPGLYPRGTEVGVVLDLMIHDLELILHIVNSKVKKVEASGMPVLSKTEDIASARITFKNGCIANVNASRINDRPVRKTLIYQTNSFISLDYGERAGFVCTKGKHGLDKEKIPVTDHNALAVELDNFIKNTQTTIKTGTVPSLKVPGRRGLEALRLAIKITEELHAHNRKYSLYDEGMPRTVNHF